MLRAGKISLSEWNPLIFCSICSTHPMMTSSKGNIFCVNGHLYGEFTGHRWSPRKRPVRRSFRVFCCFFICAWINGWVNNREAGDLRRHRAHYDVIVIVDGCMVCIEIFKTELKKPRARYCIKMLFYQYYSQFKDGLPDKIVSAQPFLGDPVVAFTLFCIELLTILSASLCVFIIV